MKLTWAKNAAAAALMGYVCTVATPAGAAITDYQFQLDQTEIKKGDAEIAVRLTDKRTGKAVRDAVIFAEGIDMAPDGMEAMTSSIAAPPSTEPGVYRFKIDLIMEDGSALARRAISDRLFAARRRQCERRAPPPRKLRRSR